MCRTTPIALHPDQYTLFQRPNQCPVNGFGGSWYTIPFQGIPIYNRGEDGVLDNISWQTIDQWALVVANIWVTTGACLGLCLAVLAYIIALTPNKKKGLPFHTGMMLALIFEIGRLLCDLGRAASAGLSPYSAYLGLTNDINATTYSTSFQGVTILGMICGTIACFFTFFCLYVQATGLLTGVHLRWRVYYIGLISYLLTASALALALRVTITVVQSLYIERGLNSFPTETFYDLRQASNIAFAVSLGSWCSISCASVFWLMFTRSKLIVSNRPYDTALTILSLVFMESMLVPMIFIILQTLSSAQFPLAELVVIPSILVLLPMGSLFMTIHTVAVDDTSEKPASKTISAPTITGPNELDSRPLIGQPVESYPLKTFTLPVDRELEAIDSMDTGEFRHVREPSDLNALLKDRRATTHRNLAAKAEMV